MFALNQRRADVVDRRTVFHQPRNNDADIVDRQFCDERGDEVDEFIVRLFTVLNRLLDGFEGKLTTSKYAKLAKCSHDTALRDILQLVEREILVRNPEGGRSTSYTLVNSAAR